MVTLANRDPDTKRLWTEAELLALPETARRVELLDGELIAEPSPGSARQARVGRLYELLRQWAARRDPRPDVCLSALDLRLAQGRILQPDVFVDVRPMPRPVPAPLTAIPDLCVEVVSAHRVHDRVTKRQVHAEAGVREYWTVVAQLGILERWTGPGLREREELRDALVTPLLPGFRLDVADLLKEP
jgi:Uma2 family endonuclease